MVRNSNYIIISGFISVSLFLFFLSLFVYMLFSSHNIKSFALKKDNYISVSIDFTIPKTKQSKKNKKTDTEVKDSVDIPNQDIDIGNMFEKVWTKKIDPKKAKKKNNNKRLLEIQKKVKTLKNNNVKDISKIVENIDKTSLEKSTSSASTSNEVNEYLAKIQALVYQHFFPPQNSQGHSVKAVINLSAIGKVMDFRILNYSANSSLNAECDKIKARLMGVVFPINPQNRSGNYIIILTSKE